MVTPLRAVRHREQTLGDAVGQPRWAPCLEQRRTQQPGRLQRHADALADDRMGLAGGIADAKRRVVAAQADARGERARREPGADPPGAAQSQANAAALLLQQGLDDVAGAPAGGCVARGLQPVAADAARQRGHPAIAIDDAAVASVERQDRQQTFSQRGIVIGGLECQQVPGTQWPNSPQALGRQAFPRAVRRDRDARAQGSPFARGPRAHDALPVAGPTLDRQRRPRLEDVGAACPSLLQQQGVQCLAPQRAAPAQGRVIGRQQVGNHGAVRAHQRHLTQFRASAGQEGVADAQHLQQGKVARGNALAADFASRKTLLLDQRDRPASPRQQDGAGGARRAGADDDGVKVGRHGCRANRRAPAGARRQRTSRVAGLGARRHCW